MGESLGRRLCQEGGYHDFQAIEMVGTEEGSEARLRPGTDSSIVSETGCPAGRLYRECQPSEGCPFSCAHVTGQVACFSESCEEGCHCPEGTFQHHVACVQVRTQMAWTKAVATASASVSSLPPRYLWPLRQSPLSLSWDRKWQ